MSEPAGHGLAPQRTYGNWRLGRRPGMFGLGPGPTAVAFGIIALAFLMSTVSTRAALYTVLLGAATLAPLAIRVNGRTGLQVLAARMAWTYGRSLRQHVYLSGVASAVTQAHTLPGLLAQSRVYEVETGRAGRIGVVVIPQSRHYTITLRCAPEGTELVDQSVIDARVGRLAAWLSSLCREPMLVQAQVTIESMPDPGSFLAGEVESTTHVDAPDLARQVLDEVVRTYPAGSALMATRVSLTFQPPPRRSLSHEAMCIELAAKLPLFHAGLVGAGASAIAPMSAAELARAVRTAYDPASSLDLTRDTTTTLDWSQAGPVATREGWDDYRHDSGLSRTWGMVEAPRGVVFATTFSRLSEPEPSFLCNRTTIIYRPYAPAEAARLVENDKRDARFTASKGPRPSAREMADLDAADQAAQEEAAGAGMIRFTVLVTATVRSPRELDDAARIVQSRAGEARLFLRPMYGCQAATFAAGLPAGVVLTSHTTIPF
ncbi:SCO6880 family protein [Dactylosporangium sp. CA-092794]|uniref:SCO6880 family protein n=1 Tax=Dactylosporangium sp. CA-092794 TaxID=3239929 RepID=UPI003D92FDA9